MWNVKVPVAELRKAIGDDSKLLDMLEKNYQSPIQRARESVASTLERTAKTVKPK